MGQPGEHAAARARKRCPSTFRCKMTLEQLDGDAPLQTRVLSARYTSPMPPSPISRYAPCNRPSMSPGAELILVRVTKGSASGQRVGWPFPGTSCKNVFLLAERGKVTSARNVGSSGQAPREESGPFLGRAVRARRPGDRAGGWNRQRPSSVDAGVPKFAVQPHLGELPLAFAPFARTPATPPRWPGPSMPPKKRYSTT